MLKNAHIWLPGYLASRKRGEFVSPPHVFFCFVDHYEPLWAKPSLEIARSRTQHWRTNYPKFADRFRDADGRPPQHTFFFPAEEYRPEFLDDLAHLSRQGYGEVEIHLHHRNDTAANLKASLEDFKVKLRGHGFLTEDRGQQSEVSGQRSAVRYQSSEFDVQGSKLNVQPSISHLPSSNSQSSRCAPVSDRALNPTVGLQFGGHSNAVLSNSASDSGLRTQDSGLPSSQPSSPTSQSPSLQSQVSSHKSSSIRYGFIHGNWALDNSRRDGDWCGVNNELQVLRATGCYADFTLPSAPSDTQTRKVNAIYYATDDPLRPKSHDTGIDVCVGGQATGDLLIVQGPLALNWQRRKWGCLPRIEHADVAGGTLPTSDRIDLWIRQRIGVVGKPDWIFVKVHTHGCQENNFVATLGTAAAQMHEYLARQPFVLHYVTAREVYNLIKAAEAGLTGDPNQYRDFILPPPPVRQ